MCWAQNVCSEDYYKSNTKGVLRTNDKRYQKVGVNSLTELDDKIVRLMGFKLRMMSPSCPFVILVRGAKMVDNPTCQRTWTREDDHLAQV